ncbi:MAG TPA: type II secretion system F family protein [Candidatus Nitrosotalea sp.]|nr:type II secretion system F family protein [Candidatus Nitrosotalea sp.]
MTPLLLALLAALGVFMFFVGLARRPNASAADMVAERLQSYVGVEKVMTEDDIVLQLPFSDRFMRPAIERFGRYFAERTSAKQRYQLLAQLDLAGRPGDLSPEDFTAVRYVACVILFALGLLIGTLTQNPAMIALIAGAGGVLGFYGPLYWLRTRVKQRQREIQLALPDTMDLLTIAVEAGLGFDAAISRVSQKFDNALADEFGKVLQETRLGRPRLEAMDEMGRRSGVEDLHNFVQAVIQSEQMGVGVARILRLQSDEMRRKRRQRAQEKAAQASLKMMLPMVGCIFPTLWVVLLGPAVLILLKARG